VLATPGGDRCEPPNPYERKFTVTIPADAVLRERHLKSALGHIQQAIICTEGLAASDGDYVDQLYRDRATLRNVADTIRDIIDDIPARRTGRPF
jgi:hypothetical protein